MGKINYGKELLNITGEAGTLSKSEFEDYIEDYTRSCAVEEYEFDINSDYYKALLWAKDNIHKAFELMKKSK
ncbi:MAG: hypothetical protein GF317_24525 [Candidatus Lokiarchaeota archaeon]|nr:hypothetical protein [Candidatus Lokiarchaeota archaeon]